MEKLMKTALITGGATRIGCALATALAERGNNVIIHYHHSFAAAHALATQLTQKFSIKATTVAADLTDIIATENLITHAANLAAAPLDYLINNAAIYPPSSLNDLTFADWQVTTQINAYAPLQLMRAFAAQVPAAVASGNANAAILNLLDTRDYDRAHLAYHLSKNNLGLLTKIAAREYAPQVRVNGLALGLILPPLDETDDWLTARRESNPLKRIGTLHDVSTAALLLLENAFITGEILHVAGGRQLNN